VTVRHISYIYIKVRTYKEFSLYVTYLIFPVKSCSVCRYKRAEDQYHRKQTQFGTAQRMKQDEQIDHCRRLNPSLSHAIFGKLLPLVFCFHGPLDSIRLVLGIPAIHKLHRLFRCYRFLWSMTLLMEWLCFTNAKPSISFQRTF
jgi:hypothetical protein